MRYLFFQYLFLKALIATAGLSFYALQQENTLEAGIHLAVGLPVTALWYFAARKFRWQIRDSDSAAWTCLRTSKKGAVVGAVLGIVTALAVIGFGYTSGSSEELEMLGVVAAACFLVGTAVPAIGYGVACGMRHGLRDWTDEREQASIAADEAPTEETLEAANRPIAITLICSVLVVAALTGLCFSPLLDVVVSNYRVLPESVHRGIFFGEVFVSLLAGIGMFLRQRWCRLIYVLWYLAMPIVVFLTFNGLPAVSIPGFIMFVCFVLFLFIGRARPYFAWSRF